MIPMGTVMAGCMIVGVLCASRLPGLKLIQRLPVWLRSLPALLVFAAGAWNVFWYALRHITEYWGVAALISGILMMLTAVFIFDETRLPAAIQKLRPVILLLLLLSAVHYAVTIYRL